MGAVAAREKVRVARALRVLVADGSSVQVLALETLNTRQGLTITHKTAACRWLGESLNYNQAVETLYRAESDQECGHESE